jgi:hypothetical protein
MKPTQAGKMENTMQKKSIFAYAIAIAGVVILSGAAVTPALSREAQKAINATTYQLQSANSSYAFAPRENTGPRYGQCWIATDASRPYGYSGSCASPLVRDPSLDPTYNPEW